MSKIFFVAIHKTKFYRSLKSNYGDLSTTEDICDRMLSLPMYPDLKETEMDLIHKSIGEFFSSRSN